MLSANEANYKTNSVGNQKHAEQIKVCETAINAAIEKGYLYCDVYEDLYPFVLNELKQYGYIVTPHDGRNERFYKISWGE